MKQILILLMLILGQYAFAQDPIECRKIIDLTIESINKQSSKELEPFLANDFKIAGQKGAIAKMVLSQLFSQLGETVKSHAEINQNIRREELELVFMIDYKNKGKKEATFIFNQNNLLQELSLFKMEVKTMCEKSKVEKTAKEVIEIPFGRAGNLITVEVLLNGVKRKFILDSGAPRVILNSRYTSKKEASERRISSVKGVSGNISGMDIIKVKSLDFEGIQLNNQDIITVDLSRLEKGLDCPIYGLIGFEIIKDYDVVFDYEKQLLTLVQPDSFEKYKKENLFNNQLDIIPFELRGHLPIIKAKINQETINLGIDSGAESNLIDKDLFPKLKKHITQKGRTKLMGADNKKTKVKKGKIKKMIIGNKSFKKQKTVFSNISHLNKERQLNIDGLIGYPILSKQKTILSFQRKELIFIE